MSLKSKDREEFLATVKERALEELEHSGDPSDALSSFMSDISKFEGDKPIYSPEQTMVLMQIGIASAGSVAEMKHWIKGCN